MYTDRFTPTDARTNSGSATPAKKQLRADGGFPIGRVFELTDADRVSDLAWAEYSDGQLYAIEVEQEGQAPIHRWTKESISTAVAINIHDGMAREVDIDELTLDRLSHVDDALRGMQRLD